MHGMDDTRPDGPDHRRLFEIAAGQKGHFTAEQAVGCGIGHELLSRGAAAGRYLRVARGVYRLRDFPAMPNEEIAAAWLRLGRDVAVISHASALAMHELGDVVPGSVHAIVPRARRDRARLPGIVVHTSVDGVPEREATEREGIRVTTPGRTLVDVAEMGIDPDHLARAVGQAITRGWIEPDDLERVAAARSERVRVLIGAALAEVAK